MSKTTIKEIEKEFDKRFRSRGMFGMSGPYQKDEVKSFYRTQILAMLEGLKGKYKGTSTFTECSDPKREGEYGYNQAIRELNEKIERITK